MSKSSIIPLQEAHLPDSQKSDDILITMFQAGEKKVFRILVERYQEKIRNLLYSIFNNVDFIDDIAQEIFIKVYEALPKFRFESSFYTWLYRIAINKSRDEMRKKKIRKYFSLQVLLEIPNNDVQRRMSVAPDDSIFTKEMLQKALQKIPENYRMPIVLKDMDGFSYEEIAEMLECEIGTVKSRLFRGRVMLKDFLEPLVKEQ